MEGKTGFDNVFAGVLSRRNIILLVLFWAAGIFFVVSYGTVSGRLGSEPAISVVAPVSAQSGMGHFSAWCQTEVNPAGHSYHVAFDNLSAGHGASGIFKTASHKRVQIENLRVTFEAVSDANGASPVRLGDFCDLLAPRFVTTEQAMPFGMFDACRTGQSTWSIDVDLTNATEVKIENLDWRVRAAGATVLQVQCRHAFLHADGPGVTLRGHVTVTTPQAVLEGNCIEVDVQDECFVVDGRYLLARGREKQTGQRGRFDTALGTIDAGASDSGENRVWADGSQYGLF